MRYGRWLWLVMGVAAAAACAHQTGGAGGTRTELLVSAAASLTDAFADIKLAFEDQNPGVDVRLNLSGSSALREQILDGAPADVFASANTSNMDQLIESGAVQGGAMIFAHNRLTIAVPKGNPAGITGLTDFANPGLLIGLCAASVPCGGFARQALRNAGVTASIDTNEPDVRALLTKIEAGELDAGITYVTDVASTHGKAEAVDIPSEDNVIADYSIAVLSDASHREDAGKFVGFVMSRQGQAILAKYGFLSP